MPEHSQTIPDLLATNVAASPDRQALATIVAGQQTWRTWAEINTEVQQLAQAMLAIGIQHGDRVIQVAANCYEWIVTDLAIHEIGAVHVPLHVSLSKAQIVEQIADCGARLAFFSAEAFEKVTDRIAPNLQTVYYGKPTNTNQAIGNPTATSRDEFISNTSSESKPTPPQADDLATLLYTSGTTGSPRGVMLSHRNIVSNAIATADTIKASPDDLRLCFLPLSHIYARTCDLYNWLYRGSRIVLAENRDTVLRDCQIAKPTIINGVPYFYQKLARRQNLSDLLGGKIQQCYCGGAAIAPEIEKLLADQGLTILLGYGLTESSPVISIGTPEYHRPGSVGRPLPGLEVRIDQQGEILVRGPNVMLGYWQNETATNEAIVKGWLHTGDTGEFDDIGNLRIVGRQKEILVLMTGKNVSPTRIEQMLAGSALIENACVVGDDQKCLAALIVPNQEALSDKLQGRQIQLDTNSNLTNHPQVQEIYRQEIDRVLADASQEEQVGPFLLVDRPFSVEQGEMTAKLSLRRKIIETNYADEINTMFAG